MKIDFNDVIRKDPYRATYQNHAIPAHINDALSRYLLQGLEPGGFLSAIIACDYERALYNADRASRADFWAIGRLVLDFVPPAARGDYGAVDEWCDPDSVDRAEFVKLVEKHVIWAKLSDRAPTSKKSFEEMVDEMGD